MKDQWPDRPPRVVAVRPLDGYCLELTFNNGTVGTADLADLIVDADGVFLPLRDKLFFDQVRLSDGGTIEWLDEQHVVRLFALLQHENTNRNAGREK